jgi:hypothetical protein
MTIDIVTLAHEIAHEREAELARTTEYRRVAAELEDPRLTARAARRVGRSLRRGYRLALRHVTEPPALAS